MLTYPNIDPIAFYIGQWPVYWYGLMYLISFLGGWGLLLIKIKYTVSGFTNEEAGDIAFYAALGAIIGGRLGYMLFYDWNGLLSDPLLVFQTWKGGMSFHGGLIGVVVGMWLYAKKINKPFLALTDFVAPVIPFGLAAGRIGNFINSELWGRVTDVPWAITYPNAGPLPRHPSQLYEFGMEGILLFIILWLYAAKPRPVGAVSGVFAIFYGIFRCIAEFFREPDAHIGYFFGWMTEGQLLSVPLIAVGLLLVFEAYRYKGLSKNNSSS